MILLPNPVGDQDDSRRRDQDNMGFELSYTSRKPKTIGEE